MVNASQAEDLTDLWGNGRIRVFISHTSARKDWANQLKSNLEMYGVASFVAHEDIVPMKEWQHEIRRALFSMDVLVALLTRGFSRSDWTDQEVGVAIGLGIPIIPIRMGKDPYGFFGKYQALSGQDKSPQDMAFEILGIISQSAQRRVLRLVREGFICSRSGPSNRRLPEGSFVDLGRVPLTAYEIQEYLNVQRTIEVALIEVYGVDEES